MKKVIVIAVAMVFGFAGLALAADKFHNPTMTVPTFLSISSTTGDFTLTFTGFDSGDETNVESVAYVIAFNNSTITDGAVKAVLSAAYTGVALKADVTGYSKSAGNASLAEQTTGFTAIGTTATNIAKRVTDSGSGKTSKGTLNVDYKGVATAVLEPGSEQKQLTITLVDA